MQMTSEELGHLAVSVSLSQTQLAVTESYPLGGSLERPLVEFPWPRIRRNVKWGLESNTAWYDQEEKKLCVNIAV